MTGAVVREIRSPSSASELRRGAAVGALLYGAGVVVRTICEVVFARAMGARQFGAYSYVFSWLSILAVAGGLGIPYALVRLIPQYEVSDDPLSRRQLARFGRRLALASGVALAACGGAVVIAVRPSGVTLVAVALGMATVPLLALFTMQSELARGFRRVVLAYLPYLVMRPLATLAITLAILAGTGTVTAEQGLLAGLLAVALCLAAQRSRVGKLLARDPSHGASGEGAASAAHEDQRFWLGVALPLLAVNLLAAITMRADVIIAGAMQGSQAAGVYAAAARVALLSTFGLEALNMIVAPTLSRLYFRGELDAVQRVVRTAARVTLATSLLATLLLELAGTRSLAVFGGGFTGGMTALQVLLIGQLINASTGPVMYLMIATGEQNLAAIAQGVSTAIFIAAAIPMTAAWGIVGTAAAVTLSRAAINVWMALAAQRRLGVRAFVV